MADNPRVSVGFIIVQSSARDRFAATLPPSGELAREGHISESRQPVKRRSRIVVIVGGLTGPYTRRRGKQRP